MIRKMIAQIKGKRWLVVLIVGAGITNPLMADPTWSRWTGTGSWVLWGDANNSNLIASVMRGKWVSATSDQSNEHLWSLVVGGAVSESVSASNFPQSAPFAVLYVPGAINVDQLPALLPVPQSAPSSFPAGILLTNGQHLISGLTVLLSGPVRLMSRTIPRPLRTRLSLSHKITKLQTVPLVLT